jgi:5-methylcytosine-specific restriction enzyme B
MTEEWKLAQVADVWDTFLREWPLERLQRMKLPEYTAAGQDQTFTAWIESRLDKLGSIWGGSAFKFGIYSRKNKTPKDGDRKASYTADYAWYSKYGATPEEAFARVKSLVVLVADSAARADYAAINSVDLGEAYKWKIAFHYQDRSKPGVIAVFKRNRLKAWLRGRVGTLPDETSDLHRQVLSLQPGKDLMALSAEVWNETAPLGEEDEKELEEEAESEVAHDDLSDHPLNLILYGPPGTGKTYLTSQMAVNICDGVLPDTRDAIMARYRELRNLQRIRFVTFHPSFSYEEFVEGIRPSTENGQVRYDVRAGVLKQAVAYARDLYEKRGAPAATGDLKDRKLFKMSLGDTSKSEEAWIYPDCIENGYVCIGFATETDFTGCDSFEAVRDRYTAGKPDREETAFAITALHTFKNEVRNGNLVLVSEGNTRFRAVGEVAGPYVYRPRELGYVHCRPIRWLWTASQSVPVETVFAKRLSQRTIYLMDQAAVKWPAMRELLAPKQEGNQAPNCVLIIDEINRANLAKTFGELITLLEPSKRLGRSDEQESELPYSGELLGVPPNLYVVGTMNTADRSIALMDTALRRRFEFLEMTPRVDCLEKDVEGIDVQALLAAINRRIEGLFDRDHVLGHTYLMGVRSFDDLVRRFRGQIIPLLQEYFFEDWRRIQQVFNDVDQPAERQIIETLTPAPEGGAERRGQRYRVNPTISPAAIQKIYT